MSDEFVDFYQVLGVSEDATQEQIETIYSRLMRIYHPDINSEKSANEQTARINAAYEVLGNPAKRREFDQVRCETYEDMYSEQEDYETSQQTYYYEEVSTGKSSGFMHNALKPFAILLLVLLWIILLALRIISYPAYLILMFICVISLILSIVAFFFIKNTACGIVSAVVALFASPFGIPLVSEWLIRRLRRFNYSLGDFIRN